MRSLKDRVVVLTGAAGGIGRALAVAFARSGARLALVDQKDEALDELARHCSAGTSVHLHDIATPGAAGRIRDEVLERHGAFHVLVNNAGMTIHGTVDALAPDDLDRVLAVDLLAPVLLTRALLPDLLENDESHIVFMASMAGLMGFPFQAPYCAAKSGLIGFGRAIATELAGTSVDVTTVVPGTIATTFLSDAPSRDPGMSAALGRLMQRFGTPPEKVARAALHAIRRRRAEVHVGWDCHVTRAARTLTPPLLPSLLAAGVRAYRDRCSR